jgi:peptidoglycan/LPS O-acetylase OafA/YrhL
VLHIVSIKVGMVALISGLLVWLASYDAGYLLRPGVASRALSWLGARSYAIYLIHIPAFFLVREIFYRLAGGNGSFGDSHFWPFVLTAGALILLLAELNYRLVEVPLRNRGATVAKRMMSAESVGRSATA